MITSSLPWAAKSTRNKAVVVDLANRLVAHPRFAELKATVDKAWHRVRKGEAFEPDHEQVDNYLNAAIVEKKPDAVALQTLIASDLGVSLKPCVGLFGGRYLDIPEPSAVAAQAGCLPLITGIRMSVRPDATFRRVIEALGKVAFQI